MISEWFLGLALGAVGWLAGLFGEWEPPAELTDMATQAQVLVGQFASLGVWVPWGVIAACVGASVTTWAIVLGIKTVRAAAAHIPAIGGSGD